MKEQTLPNRYDKAITGSDFDSEGQVQNILGCQRVREYEDGSTASILKKDRAEVCLQCC